MYLDCQIVVFRSLLRSQQTQHFFGLTQKSQELRLYFSLHKVLACRWRIFFPYCPEIKMLALFYFLSSQSQSLRTPIYCCPIDLFVPKLLKSLSFVAYVVIVPSIIAANVLGL